MSSTRPTGAAERGMRSLGDDSFPINAPYASSGDRRKATDAFEGEWNGLQTLFYNFTYTDEGSGDDSDTDYDFKIMRLTGPRASDPTPDDPPARSAEQVQARSTRSKGS